MRARLGSLASLAPALLALAGCDPDPVVVEVDAHLAPDAPTYADSGVMQDAPGDSVDAAEVAFDVRLPGDVTLEDAVAADAAALDAMAVDARGDDAFFAGDAAEPALVVGFCRIQYPASITTTAGATTVVYGRVYVEGLTTRTGGTDVDARLIAEVGVGPDASDPATASGWSWVAASANTGYGPGGAGYEANNDEYQGDLVAPAAGTYDYAYRFSGDGGLTWTYCDADDAGSSDGYEPAEAGALIVS